MKTYGVVLILVLTLAYLGPGLSKPVKASEVQEQLGVNISEYDKHNLDNLIRRESQPFGSIAPFADDDGDGDDDDGDGDDDDHNPWMGLKPGVVICLVFAGLALLIALPMIICYICARCSRKTSPADLTRDPIQTLRQSISYGNGNGSGSVYTKKEAVDIRRNSMGNSQTFTNNNNPQRKSSTGSGQSFGDVSQFQPPPRYSFHEDLPSAPPRRLSIQNPNHFGFENFPEKS